MDNFPLLGILLHAVGGLAAGSFYIPYKKVKSWAWESYWLVGGFFSWIITPWIVALLAVPKLGTVLIEAPAGNIIWSYLFGVLWGIGGVTFGLTMRYLGMSLGYSLALGLTATFGTIIPPVYFGQAVELLTSFSGQITLFGILVCLFGIALCGKAGMQKDKELSAVSKKQSIREFDLKKGIWVAILAGIMSACFAFGIAAGKPIAELAVEKGTPSLWQNSVIFVIILAGGFTTNFLWCIYLNIKNKTIKDYLNIKSSPIVQNFIFCALAGITWYCQFMFYGMGTTRMGKYDFSSWSIHMAFIIIFSNLWGLYLKEWTGSSHRTINLIIYGLIVLTLSIFLIGAGNYFASSG